MSESQYQKIQKTVDAYFTLLKKIMTGRGNVSPHILKKLKIDGRKIEGLLPKMIRYGTQKACMKQTGPNEIKVQIRQAQRSADLAIENMRIRTMQTVCEATAGAGTVSGAAIFAMVAAAVRERKQDFAFDSRRIVRTCMQEAKEHGFALTVRKMQSGDSTKVIKRCSDSACTMCTKAYTNPDGTPKVFTIGQLEKNGTNICRRTRESLPVLGCMHPGCMCTLEILEEQ